MACIVITDWSMVFSFYAFYVDIRVVRAYEMSMKRLFLCSEWDLANYSPEVNPAKYLLL